MSYPTVRSSATTADSALADALLDRAGEAHLIVVDRTPPRPGSR
jgi:hypothetical protein